MNAQQTLDDFVNYLLVEKAMNPGTVRNYQSYVQRLISFLNMFRIVNSPDKAEIVIDDITPETIEDFKKWLLQDGLTHKTINYYLIGIRVFLKYCEKKKIKCMNPYDVEKYARIKNKEVKLLTDAQLEIFLTSKVNDKSDLLANLLFGTGLRIFELHDLDLSKVSKDKNYATITGKGDKERIVYLMGNSHKMLIKYMEEEDRYTGPIFLNKHGEPLTIRYMQGIVNERAKRLLPYGTHISAHMLRHHFATTLLNKGAKLSTVQKVLGHSSVITTMKYLHVSDKETREELADINKIF